MQMMQNMTLNEKMLTERQKIWRVLSLIWRFLTPSATITLNASWSQQTPRFFFFLPRDRPCSRVSSELIYYDGRNVPVMLTPVIGNNVCRERIEKEKGKRVRKKRMDSTSFLLRVTHLICVEYVPRAKYPENSNSPHGVFGLMLQEKRAK